MQPVAWYSVSFCLLQFGQWSGKELNPMRCQLPQLLYPKTPSALGFTVNDWNRTLHAIGNTWRNNCPMSSATKPRIKQTCQSCISSPILSIGLHHTPGMKLTSCQRGSFYVLVLSPGMADQQSALYYITRILICHVAYQFLISVKPRMKLFTELFSCPVLILRA